MNTNQYNSSQMFQHNLTEQSRIQNLKPRQILPTAARRRRGDRRLLYFVVFIFAFIAILTGAHLSRQIRTEAASLDHFDPGNIITDYNMSNYTSMSESEIQNFLNSKVSCNRSADAKSASAIRYEDVSESGYNRRYYFYNSAGNIVSALYHVENNRFVCMKDEKFDPATGTPSKSSNAETAAHIIYTVAHEYKINPQVLIVLLQKEQGLITDNFPNHIQYRAATGYGCPDTAACDSKYYGLRNQISNAAKLFRTVLDGGWTNYPLGKNYIQYNPNKSCGGTEVNIKNLATSGLYRYTPYQPNAAALKAGYATVSDSCAAYGNRNFYLYFADWFSDPTDDSKANPLGVNATKLSATEKNVLNKIIERYKALGGESKLGKAKTNLESYSGTGIYWIEFEKGFIVGNDKHGYYESFGKIREVWKKKGFESSNLGFPISNIEINKETGISWQYYEGGAIVGDDKRGYYESSGKIREVWQKQRFEYGPLGFPTSNIEETKSSGIKFQYYEGGAIVGNDKHGYYESRGGIRDVWKSKGFEFSYLGFPTSNIEETKSSGIKFQYYEGGAIVGNDKHGYYESSGKIRDAWASQKYEFGKLGFPTSNIYDVKVGQKAQKYEGGTIYLDTRSNKTTIEYKK